MCLLNSLYLPNVEIFLDMNEKYRSVALESYAMDVLAIFSFMEAGDPYGCKI